MVPAQRTNSPLMNGFPFEVKYAYLFSDIPKHEQMAVREAMSKRDSSISGFFSNDSWSNHSSAPNGLEHKMYHHPMLKKDQEFDEQKGKSIELPFKVGDRVRLHSFRAGSWLNGLTAIVQRVRVDLNRSGRGRNRIRARIQYEDPELNGNPKYPMNVHMQNFTVASQLEEKEKEEAKEEESPHLIQMSDNISRLIYNFW